MLWGSVNTKPQDLVTLQNLRFVQRDSAVRRFTTRACPRCSPESVWLPIAERAARKGTRFHDLRHFFASQVIANGETTAFVRDQMGHSSDVPRFSLPVVIWKLGFHTTVS